MFPGSPKSIAHHGPTNRMTVNSKISRPLATRASQRQRLRTLRQPRSSAICGVALGLTVGLTTLTGGGFSDHSRSMFVALSGASLLLSIALHARATTDLARSTPVCILIALSALCIASAAWTVGEPSDAFLWGLTIASYGAIAITAGAFARLSGPGPLAIGIVVLAIIEAILALWAMAFHHLPSAEVIDGVWRPGGTFQYPPALSVLELGALTIMNRVMRRTSGPVAGAAATSAVLAGSVIALAGSRLMLALALVFLTAPIFTTRHAHRARLEAIVATALVLSGALVVRAISLGHLPQGAGKGGWPLLGAITVLTLGCGATWTLIHWRSHQNSVWIPLAVCLASGALAVTLASDAPLGQPTRAASRSELSERPSLDLLHGRSREWRAATRTWLQRPVLGSGAAAYYTASLPYQGASPTLYAHDLPLELAAELGTLGLMLALALYLTNAWTIAAARHNLALELLAPTVVAFLASNLIDWTWHLAGLGAVWAVALGGLAGCAGNNARSTPAPDVDVGRTGRHVTVLADSRVGMSN
jgi:O-Antigen ligase